jgi:hypothetical protein
MNKFSLILILSVLTTSSDAFSSATRVEKVLSRELNQTTARSIEKTISLETYLQSAYNKSKLRVEKSIAKDGFCGEAYFISVFVPSYRNSVQVEAEYYFQTLTKESQDHLYDAIAKNLSTKGLPACLLQDQYYSPDSEFFTYYKYNYDPDYTTVGISAKMLDLPADHQCASKAQRQYTSCWNIEDPYTN